MPLVIGPGFYDYRYPYRVRRTPVGALRERSVCRGDTHIGLDVLVRVSISTIYKPYILKLSLGPATSRWWRRVYHVSHVAQGLNS